MEFPQVLAEARSVLLVGVFPEWALHQAWESALADLIFRSGKQVKVSGCSGVRLYCEANVSFPLNKDVCKGCVQKKNEALSQLKNAGVEVGLIVDREAVDLNSPAYQFTDITSLKAFVVDGFDAGMAALCSWVDLVKKSQPDCEGDWKTVSFFVSEAVRLYRHALKSLAVDRPDVVGIFNGRLIYTRPWLRACERLGVNFFCYDHGSDLSRLRIVENASMHSIAAFERDCLTHWDKRPDDQSAKKTAGDFYMARLRGGDVLTSKFTATQQPDKLPAWWRSENRWVTVFISSMDEFAAIGKEWDGGLYTDQLTGLRAITTDPRFVASDLHMAIRVHPRLAQIGGEEWKSFLSVASDRVFIVEPSSPVSSYALMFASEKVISFGSSMGIESAYFEKPSLLLKSSYYQDLGSCYFPSCHDELMTLLLDPHLPALPVDGAVKYGYFLSTVGLHLPNLAASSNGGYVYDGASGAVKGGRVSGVTLVDLLRITRPSKRDLIFVSAGANETFASHALDELSDWFDVAVFDYSGAIRDELASRAHLYAVGKGTKFNALQQLHQLLPGYLGQYESVWVCDDDLILEHGDARNLTLLVKNFGLKVISPAHSEHGKMSHELMLPFNGNHLFRYVNFVEMGCPMFGTQHLIDFLSVYDGSLDGWGIDWWYLNEFNARDLPVAGIVDSVIFLNPHDKDKPGGKRELDRWADNRVQLQQWLRKREEVGLVEWEKSNVFAVYDVS